MNSRFLVFIRILLLGVVPILFFNLCGLTPNNGSRLVSLLDAAGTSTSSPTSSSSASPTSTSTATDSLPAVTIVPINGSGGRIYAYSVCLSSAGITSTLPVPDTGGGSESEFSSTDYTHATDHDGTYATKECEATSSLDTQLVEGYVSLSTSTASAYSSFTVTWIGQAGGYGVACNGSNSPSSAVTQPELDVYDGTTWHLVGNPSASSGTVTATFDTPSNWLSSEKIWFRYTSGSNSNGNCATTQMDTISFLFSP